MVDVHGRMQEKHGRHFCKLLLLLAAITVPKLNAERGQAKEQPLAWNDRDSSANSMETREIVMSYILREIDWLADEIEKQTSLACQILGRRLTREDKNNIRSWKLHVKDDFFVLGHLPAQGTVMVQVGRLRHREDWWRRASITNHESLSCRASPIPWRN